MDDAHAVQGILHSHYSLEALLASLIATSIIVHGTLPWYPFYYVMVSGVLPSSPHPVFVQQRPGGLVPQCWNLEI